MCAYEPKFYRENGRTRIHGVAEWISSVAAAIQGAIREEHAAVVEEQARHIRPALLLPHLHVPHLLHTEGRRVSLLYLHILPERLRSRDAGGAADSAVRGQELSQAPLL